MTKFRYFFLCTFDSDFWHENKDYFWFENRPSLLAILNRNETFWTFLNTVKFSWLEGLKGSVLQNEEETSFWICRIYVTPTRHLTDDLFSGCTCLCQKGKKNQNIHSVSKIVLFISFSRFFIADEFFQKQLHFHEWYMTLLFRFRGWSQFQRATTQKSCLFLNANEMDFFFWLDRLLSSFTVFQNLTKMAHLSVTSVTSPIMSDCKTNSPEKID